MKNIIKNCFTESIQTQIVSADTLSHLMEQAAQRLVDALLSGNKVLVCGNGTSAVSAQSFAARLIDCGDIERPSIPVMALVCDNGFYSEVYAKQIQAFGQQGDVLIVLSTLGSRIALVRAIEQAVIKDMSIILLTGEQDDELTGLLSSRDLEIRIPSNKKVRIEEIHFLILNCLCELIEQSLFVFQR